MTKQERVARIAKYYTTFHLFSDWYLVRLYPKHSHSWKRFVPLYILMHIKEE